MMPLLGLATTVSATVNVPFAPVQSVSETVPSTRTRRKMKYDPEVTSIAAKVTPLRSTIVSAM